MGLEVYLGTSSPKLMFIVCSTRTHAGCANLVFKTTPFACLLVKGLLPSLSPLG